MTTDTKAVAWTVVDSSGESSIGGWSDMQNFEQSKKIASVREGHRYAFAISMADHERVVGELQAEVDALLEVIAPFGHFALVRSALGCTAPKGGTVYSVCTTLGDAEISAEDFEAAFNAIARNTEAV